MQPRTPRASILRRKLVPAALTVGLFAVAVPPPALAAGSATAGQGVVVSFTDAVVLAVAALALLIAGIWFHRVTASMVRETPRIVALPNDDRNLTLAPPNAAPAPTATRAAGHLVAAGARGRTAETPATALVAPPLPHAR